MRTVISHQSGPPPVVSVNDVVIAGAAIAREVQNHAGRSPKEAWEEATRALVVRELLTQRAQALGLTAEPRLEDGLRETEEEALIRVLLATEVRTPKANDDTCRRYYQANPRRFHSPDLFEPLHILFRANRRDEAAYARLPQFGLATR
jgi:peptidyl-prolyl cis-trans isomerase C